MQFLSLSNCTTLIIYIGGDGNWTTDGCRSVGVTNRIVSCECDHLTNFGVLVVSLYKTLQK